MATQMLARGCAISTVSQRLRERYQPDTAGAKLSPQLGAHGPQPVVVEVGWYDVLGGRDLEAAPQILGIAALYTDSSNHLDRPGFDGGP